MQDQPGRGGRAVSGDGLQPLACCDGGFESLHGHRCLSVVIFVCCHVEVSASGRSLVSMSPTECGVFEIDREASIMSSPWRTKGCCAMKKLLFSFCSYNLSESGTFWSILYGYKICAWYLSTK